MSCFKFKIVVLFRKINKTSMRRLLCCLSGLRSRLLAARKWGARGGGGRRGAQKVREGGGGRNLVSPPPPSIRSIFCDRPNFRAAKKTKNASKGRKSLWKCLLRRLLFEPVWCFNYRVALQHSSLPGDPCLTGNNSQKTFLKDIAKRVIHKKDRVFGLSN